MENSTTAVVIVLSVIGSIGLYLLFTKSSNQPLAIDYVSSTESAASNIDAFTGASTASNTVQVCIDHYIPRIITSPMDYFVCRTFIFKNDPIACEWLDRYGVFVYNDSLVRQFLSTRNPTLDQVEELSQYLFMSKPWQGLIEHLSHTDISDEFRTAVLHGYHIELDYIYREIREVEVEIPQSTIEQLVDFFSSEFGIKCLIVGSVVVITAIIIHLLITYNFKTTNTAIAIKCYNLITIKLAAAIKIKIKSFILLIKSMCVK